jgi:hypothetical protein
VSHKARADYRTERLCEPLPSVQDCYHCANRCLDMWNDSVDHAAQSWLLRMADAWLQLASEQEVDLVGTFDVDRATLYRLEAKAAPAA